MSDSLEPGLPSAEFVEHGSVEEGASDVSEQLPNAVMTPRQVEFIRALLWCVLNGHFHWLQKVANKYGVTVATSNPWGLGDAEAQLESLERQELHARKANARLCENTLDAIEPTLDQLMMDRTPIQPDEYVTHVPMTRTQLVAIRALLGERGNIVRENHKCTVWDELATTCDSYLIPAYIKPCGRPSRHGNQESPVPESNSRQPFAHNHVEG